MTITEYRIWLANPTAQRCLLCEITAYINATSKVTFRFGSEAFYSRPDDNPANTIYESRLVGDPSLTRSVPFYEKGRGVDDYGTIAVDNTDEQFDVWQQYLWKGMPIRLLLGDVNWPLSFFNIQPLLEGTIANKPNFTDQTIEFTIRDKMGRLDLPIQKTLLTTGPKKGEPAPLTLGTVRNIELLCIDETLLKYQWHTGAVSAITQVCDRGVPLTDYTAINSSGQLILTRRPVGTITLTGNGATANSTFLSKPGELVRFILNQCGGVSDTEIDTASLTALDTAKPYVLGRYIPDRANILDILDEILSSVGAFYLFNFFGKFTVGLIKDPVNQTPVTEFTGDENQLDNFSVEVLSEVNWRVRLQYQKNYRVQADGDIAGSISDPSYPDKTRVEWLRNDYRTASAEDTSVVPTETGQLQYYLVEDPESLPTLIDTEANAITECQSRLAILKTQRYLLKFKAVAVPFGVLPGDLIKVYDRRYSLSMGKNAQVLKITYFLLDNQAEVEAWF